MTEFILVQELAGIAGIVGPEETVELCMEVADTINPDGDDTIPASSTQH